MDTNNQVFESENLCKLIVKEIVDTHEKINRREFKILKRFAEARSIDVIEASTTALKDWIH